MQSTYDAEELAARIHAARQEQRQLAPFTSSVDGFDLAAGYEVARLLKQRRVAGGATPVGRKIGFTNRELWRIFGVQHPIWGYVYDDTVSAAPEAGATCALGSLVQPKIEPEIVFHFHSAPPADADARAMLECVDWVAQGFEIVQCHYPGWKFEAPDTVADGALHGVLLVGKAVPVARLGPDPAAALEAFTLTLFRDGDEVETGRGSNVLDSPLAALVYLRDTLAAQPYGPALQADEIVTTGTITKAHSVAPAETWEAGIRGIDLPGLTVTFTD